MSIGRHRVATKLVAAAIAVGCGALVSACSGHPTAIGVTPGPQLAHLEHQADLRPCPKTTSSPQPAPANALPDITLHCLAQGPSVNLADLRGKPTVINLYGSWCVDCQREADSLATAAAADGRQVRFLGVDVDDQTDSALSFAAATKPATHFPIVVDPNDQVPPKFDSVGLPVTLFVDSAGSVVHENRAAFDSTAQLQSDIKHYLGAG